MTFGLFILTSFSQDLNVQGNSIPSTIPTLTVSVIPVSHLTDSNSKVHDVKIYHCSRSHTSNPYFYSLKVFSLFLHFFEYLSTSGKLFISFTLDFESVVGIGQGQVRTYNVSLSLETRDESSSIGVFF